MQTSNRILDDLAKVANGAASTLSGFRSEVETFIHQQLQRLLKDADLVKREEFDAIKAVAVTARIEQEKLEARVKNLENKLTSTKATAKTKGVKKAKANKTP
jgi:BMFP domain-containing protein YqiC